MARDSETVLTLPMPDWTTPWFKPWRAIGARVWQGLGAGAAGTVAAALNAHATPATRVHFVAQALLPPGASYEAFIFTQRRVPTRDNLHDAFNGLVWLHLPRSKARLNALQAAEIAREGIRPMRGPVRDAATLFDENAVLLHAPDALWQALAARQWDQVFGRLRPLWQEARVLVFGHAALEKLMSPYKTITGHVWRVAPDFDPAGDLSALDDWLARDLSAERLAPKPFAALPLLGVPGWWGANAEAGFYADVDVFRPRRTER